MYPFGHCSVTTPLSFLRPPNVEVMSRRRLFVCLSLCEQDCAQSIQPICMKPCRIIEYWQRNYRVYFGIDPTQNGGITTIFDFCNNVSNRNYRNHKAHIIRRSRLANVDEINYFIGIRQMAIAYCMLSIWRFDGSRRSTDCFWFVNLAPFTSVRTCLVI